MLSKLRAYMMKLTNVLIGVILLNFIRIYSLYRVTFLIRLILYIG
jgi:hypothetical protein